LRLRCAVKFVASFSPWLCVSVAIDERWVS
jgi:hypothetical protein